MQIVALLQCDYMVNMGDIERGHWGWTWGHWGGGGQIVNNGVKARLRN